jgi:hypothetical protein
MKPELGYVETEKRNDLRRNSQDRWYLVESEKMLDL